MREFLEFLWRNRVSVAFAVLVWLWLFAIGKSVEADAAYSALGVVP